ncbi:MAG: hypothetical protein WD607_06345, partial [Candidatus Paceibacterota bacterium]
MLNYLQLAQQVQAILLEILLLLFRRYHHNFIDSHYIGVIPCKEIIGKVNRILFSVDNEKNEPLEHFGPINNDRIHPKFTSFGYLPLLFLC